MRAIVFGGSGFLGSHVADALVKAGYEVSVFDLVESPYLHKGQKMIIGNILDREAVRKATKGCDAVYNFAGIADLEKAKEKPIRTVSKGLYLQAACMFTVKPVHSTGAVNRHAS